MKVEYYTVSTTKGLAIHNKLLDAPAQQSIQCLLYYNVEMLVPSLEDCPMPCQGSAGVPKKNHVVVLGVALYISIKSIYSCQYIQYSA